MTAKTQEAQEAAPVLPGLLVETDWLENHMGDRRLRIVDLRDREAYGAGHVPGAVQLDLEDLGEERDGCDNVVLGPADFEDLMGRLGISNRDTVVAYDDHWGLPSARLIWALHYYGVQSCSVLNGGWDIWQEQGRPTTTDPAPAKTNTFEALPNSEVAADYEWMAEAVSRGGVVLLDTRSTAEFDDGHLPGAICWDWFNAVPAGSWECSLDPEVLRSEMEDLGVQPSDEVVAYCRSGMRAAHTYLVLGHAGFPRVRLYDGSWQEWSIRDTSDHGGTSKHDGEG